jgi:bifunctional UDP-N-acetylglucosamine pyrophosphorylase/glucosamine-1-phosphate N-acetyltransferase
MLSGVTVIDPANTYIETKVKIGKDTVIYPYTYLAGDTTVGEKCTLGPHCQMRNTQLGAGVKIGASVLDSCVIGADTTIGSYLCIEPGTVVQPGCTLRAAACGMGDDKLNG